LTADKTAAAAGETVTVTYNAHSGYEFEEIWGYETGNESVTIPLYCSGSVCTFTMPDYPVTVRAVFARATYSNPSSPSDSGSGGCNAGMAGIALPIFALAAVCARGKARKNNRGL
jgi:hypothetical protein